MELKVVEFIKKTPNWREVLTQPPYCLQIKEAEDLILLKYDQIESDFNNEIVRECRGLILDKHFNPVCVPFFKFGNYGESYVPNMDWDSIKVQEKVDGSLIKVWNYKGEWKISTNGSINAYNSELNLVDSLKINCPFQTFGELFDEAKKHCGLDFNTLNPEYTYMFELVGPFNKVVVSYDNIEIYHIGTRNNITLEEVNVDIGVKKPKLYPLTNLEECLEATQKMSYNEEGFVAVDKNWNRVKIKSPAYITAHHLRSNGIASISKILEILEQGESEEFLTYFPEYQQAFDDVKQMKENFLNKLRNALCDINNRLDGYEIRDKKHIDRKEEAFYIINNYKDISGFLFRFIDTNLIDLFIDFQWKNLTPTQKVENITKKETKNEQT